MLTSLPMVLTHGDLSEKNIMVDPVDGRVIGIVNWDNAELLPFGFALYALEHFFGYFDEGR